MKNNQRTFRLTLLSSALIAAFGTAYAQEDDEDIAPLITPTSSVSAGYGYWTNDRPQMGQYDGMRNEGSYGLFDLDIAKRLEESGSWIILQGRNLGLNDRDIRAELTRQGRYGGYFAYSRTPRNSPYTVSTRLQGIGTDTISYNRQAGNTVATPCPAGVGCQDVELGSLRELYTMGGFITLLPGLDFKVDFSNEHKSGTRQWGWGSAALFSVEPLDSWTRQLDVKLEYAGEKLQLSGGYLGSWYYNEYQQINERINGLTGTGTSPAFNALTPMSQPLNNYAHQVYADGGYSFTPTTRATFKAAYTKAYSDENLVANGSCQNAATSGGVAVGAVTTNAANVNGPLCGSPTSLNGQVDTALLQMGITSRPLDKLSLMASYRYYDVNDKTPVNQWGTASRSPGTAAADTGTAAYFGLYNTPWSYTTNSAKAEATYRLPMAFSATGGVEYSNQNRSTPSIGNTFVPFRSDISEVTWLAQVRRSFAENLSGYLTYRYSSRTGGSYDTVNQGVNPNAPAGQTYNINTLPANLINPLHIADRNRNLWRLSVDWEPIDKLSLQFRTDQAIDSYPSDGRPYGLQDGRNQVYAVDASYAITEDWLLTAYYAYNKTTATHNGFRGNNVAYGPTANLAAATAGFGGTTVGTRQADLEDGGNSAGLNLRGKITSRITVEAGGDWYDNTSSYDQSFSALGTGGSVYPTITTNPGLTVSGVGPLPSVNNNLLRLRLNGTYALDKSSDLRFDYIFERFRTDDWSYTFADGSNFNYYSGAVACTGCTPNNGTANTINVADGTSITTKQNQTASFFGVRYIYKFQ
jgi:MtrB/PioB family decaheme-associated outer membrane protein